MRARDDAYCRNRQPLDVVMVDGILDASTEETKGEPFGISDRFSLFRIVCFPIDFQISSSRQNKISRLIVRRN